MSARDGRVGIKLGKILNDYGLYPTVGNLQNVRYTIRLPKADEIMVARGNAKAGYRLEDIKHKFRVLRDPEIFNAALGLYNAGRALVYDDVSFFKTFMWNKDTSLHNIDIDVPRKKTKCVVLFFKDKDSTDSEEFLFSNITNVKLTHGGIPNYVYTDGMVVSDMFEEADDIFRNNIEYTLSEKDFFKDKFALVLDFRSVKDNEVFGSGARVDGINNGIKLAITKTPTTKDMLCHVYVVATKIINISGGKVVSLDS